MDNLEGVKGIFKSIGNIINTILEGISGTIMGLGIVIFGIIGFLPAAILFSVMVYIIYLWFS